MRIIITESQLKSILLTETKQVIIPDDKLPSAEIVVNKLISRGFDLTHACAMGGNIWIESKFNPTDGNEAGPYGLLQWKDDRLDALKKYAQHIGKSYGSLDVQVDFIKIELLNGYKLDNGKFIPNISQKLKNSNTFEMSRFNAAMKQDTVPKKAVGFAEKVERCGDCNGTINLRRDSAKKIHDYITGEYKPKKSNGNGETKKENSMIGKTIYPKKGGDGYVNIREKANRESNRIVKITSPNKIGVVLEVSSDKEGNKWYKVKLDKKVDNYVNGWVRSDMVE